MELCIGEGVYHTLFINTYMCHLIKLRHSGTLFNHFQDMTRCYLRHITCEGHIQCTRYLQFL